MASALLATLGGISFGNREALVGREIGRNKFGLGHVEGSYPDQGLLIRPSVDVLHWQALGGFT